MAPTLRTFASLAEFVDYAAGTPSTFADSARTSRDTTDAEWAGTATFADAVTLSHGDFALAKEIEKISARIRIRNMAVRKVAAMREVGPGVISMGNYIQGHPQPWIVLKDSQAAKAGKGKIVRIVVNVGASARIDADVITRRGASICALIHALESVGRRVEVTAVISTAPGSATRRVNGKEVAGKAAITYRVVVKQAFNKLNIPTLAFALASAAMLRRIGFSARECESAAITSAIGIAGGSYGMSTNDNAAPEGTDLYLPAMFAPSDVHEWETEESTEIWVRKILTEQGVKFA